jgi:hypothetical protein
MVGIKYTINYINNLSMSFDIFKMFTIVIRLSITFNKHSPPEF